MKTMLKKLCGLDDQKARERACRTRVVSPLIESFGDCLTPNRDGCRYARAFGHGVVCFNPDWRDFASGHPTGS